MASAPSPQRIVYAAIDRANEGIDTVDPLEVITRAVENSKPRVEVKSRRVGGATYQVPLEVAPDRSESLSMRWLVNYARNRKGTPMHVALANEIKDAANNQGSCRPQARRRAQDGPGQPRLRPLPLLIIDTRSAHSRP